MDVKIYLEYLATVRKIAGNTQRQALNAIVFFFRRILNKELNEIGPYEKPKLPKKLPVVLTKEEVKPVFLLSLA